MVASDLFPTSQFVKQERGGGGGGGGGEGWRGDSPIMKNSTFPRLKKK